jgi:hypothetical protein
MATPMLLALAALALLALPPAAADTLYVAKTGAGTDGRSWATAFTTIQDALDAVGPGGGHRVVVRPDHYREANLYAAAPGVAGAYNELVGDVDGRQGSGAKGWVVIDAGDPAGGGFKSYDWWSTIRATSKGWSPAHTEATFSSTCFDRWRFAGLYVTGGDAGLFFDGTNQVKPFSVVVEDCVSIGRAFGGGVASVLSRPDEPITFRRSTLWALDTWGDTGAGYIRVENQAPGQRPDAVFEDCVLVSPQCALKSSNFGFHTYSHIRLTRCGLVVLNFSQPGGEPSKGIIQSVQDGSLLAVDLEDCTLMGYKVFGVMVKPETVKDLRYTLKGQVRAYIQFQQTVPAGMTRLAEWPVELFGRLMPPPP